MRARSWPRSSPKSWESLVDLVVLGEATLEMRGKVVQEGRVVSADDARRVAFEVATRSEYFDFLPTLQAHTRRYIRQVAERGLGG